MHADQKCGEVALHANKNAENRVHANTNAENRIPTKTIAKTVLQMSRTSGDVVIQSQLVYNVKPDTTRPPPHDPPPHDEHAAPRELE